MLQWEWINSRYNNYIIASSVAFIFYLFFSLWGFGTIDIGHTFSAITYLQDGKIPYRDFHWAVTPGSFYLPYFLKKVFFFFDIVTISMLWKGLSYSLLIGVFLVYLDRILLVLKIEIKKELGLKLLLLLASTFMFIGPVHESYIGHTPDVIFFALMGIMFITWPNVSANRKISYTGYFLIGLSFCFKQEIGLIAIIVGIAHLLLKFLLLNDSRTLLKDIINPFILVILAPTFLFTYFYLNNAMEPMINSVFIHAVTERTQGISVWIKDINHLWLDVVIQREIKLALIIFVFLSVFQLRYLIHSANLKNFLNFISFGYSKYLIKTIGIIATLFAALVSFIILIKPHRKLIEFFPNVDLGYSENALLLAENLRPLFYTFNRLLFIYILIIIFMFLFEVILIIKKNKNIKNWILHYIFPVGLLLIMFFSCSLAGYQAGARLPRALPPLFMASTLIALCIRNSSGKSFVLIQRKYFSFVLFLIFIVFFNARIRGYFSTVIIDPFYRPFSYSKEYNCFMDREYYDSLKELKKRVYSNNSYDTFIYQADRFLEFLGKKSPTRSVDHEPHYTPITMYDEEIRLIKKNKVKFIITHVSHKRIDTFMFRIDDPIRDYIEENFRITYRGKFYLLWEEKSQI